MHPDRAVKLPAITWLKKQGGHLHRQLLLVLLLGSALSCTAWMYMRWSHPLVGLLSDFFPWFALLAGLLLTLQLSRVYLRRSRLYQQSDRKFDEIQAELSEKDQLVAGIFEMSPLAIALCDPGGKLISSNPAFRRMFGYSPNEVNELNYWKLSPEIDNPFDARLLGAKTDHFGPYEKGFLHKDGHLIPIALINQQDANTHGEPF